MRIAKRLLLTGALGLTGALMAGGPAAADVGQPEPVGRPTCSVERINEIRAEGSCFNGSTLFQYRVRIDCIVATASTFFGYAVISPWTPTSQRISVECTLGGFYTTSSVEIRSLAT